MAGRIEPEELAPLAPHSTAKPKDDDNPNLRYWATWALKQIERGK